MEPLSIRDPLIGYSLSDRDLRFSHFDHHQVADRVNDGLDIAEKIIRERL